ncbi:mucin-5B-like isoform X2 [Coturnix japonica]|uniref:mucin-5B-like isoform X2 n=1 Tax=Coturnix japonica TaxID=93934 RepID=UPI000777A811|nr:mucin-5B-like isoform X2 [Coturnix japonica]
MVTFFPQGFRYVEKEGQCCSQRQQVARVANFPFGTVTIEVGKSYKAPYDNCTQYTCTESGGQFSSTTTVKIPEGGLKNRISQISQPRSQSHR